VLLARRLLLTLTLLHGPLCAAATEPFRPSDDATVLERTAPAREASVMRRLREQQRALAEHPDQLDAALAFVRAAITLGRGEGDPRYYGYAESALRPWLTLADPPPAARLLRATLLQQRHDFAGALADLDVLVKLDGAEPQARLTRAVVLMVQGRPAEALRDCAALIGHADLLSAATCIASARSLDGHMATARSALDTALANARDAGPDAAIWAHTAAAEIAERDGDAAAAERHFKAAGALIDASRTRDPYWLCAWADFLIAHEQAAEARALLADATRIDNALLRLALAEATLGDPQLATHLDSLQSRFDDTRARGDPVHLREEALFELRLRMNAARALQLATDNWATQREPIDARLLLESAQAAGNPAAAQPVLDWMTKTGIEDADLKHLAAAASPATTR
jgi:hypothetical protein